MIVQDVCEISWYSGGYGGVVLGIKLRGLSRKREGETDSR